MHGYSVCCAPFSLILGAFLSFSACRFPFSSATKSMGVVVRTGSHTLRYELKGASEVVLAGCLHELVLANDGRSCTIVPLNDLARTAYLNLIQEMARQGPRNRCGSWTHLDGTDLCLCVPLPSPLSAALRTIALAFRDLPDSTHFDAHRPPEGDLVLIGIVGIYVGLRPRAAMCHHLLGTPRTEFIFMLWCLCTSLGPSSSGGPPRGR